MKFFLYLFCFSLSLGPCECFLSFPPNSKFGFSRWHFNSMKPFLSRQRDEGSEIKAVKSYEYLIPIQEDNTVFGPNVCSYRIRPARRIICFLPTVNKPSTCRYYRNSKIRSCCPGYITAPNKKGCPIERYISSESLLEVAKSNNLRDFVISVTEARLGSDLLKKGPWTLFAPNNEAFERFRKYNLQNSNDGTTDALKNLLLNHVVPGKIVAEQLYRGKEFKTLAGNIIRISKACNKKDMIIEGSKILKSNLAASNGIIHIIDRVITSSSENLKNFLEAHKEYHRFKTYLDKGGINIKSPVTIFLFSDKSMEDMNSDLLQQSCKNSKALIQNHIVKGRHFLAEFAPHGSVISLSGERLDVNLKNTSVTVNDADVIVPDISIADGVIHIINKAIVPLKVRDIRNAASRFTTTSQFMKILKSVDGDKDTLANGNWTAFIPTNDAFANLPEEVGKRIQNVDYLSKLLYYHIVPEVILSPALENDKLFPTQSPPFKLRFNVYRSRTILTVNGVQLNTFANVCNGIIYFIDEVLLPPESTLTENLKANENLSEFFKLLQNSGLAALMNGSRPFTVFAPTNKALAKLNLEQENIDNPSEELTKLLKYHIVPSVVYSTALNTPKCYSYYKSFYRSRTIPSLEGNLLKITSTGSGVVINNIMVNGVIVVQRDIKASDGVIHVTDDVLKVPKGMIRMITEMFSAL